MRTIGVILLLFTLNTSALPSAKGQTPTAQTQDDVVRVRSNEVRLDIVVKDKKGHGVKDLSASDIEVYEDGARQQIESFRFVTRETPAPGSAERNVDRKESKTEPT